MAVSEGAPLEVRLHFQFLPSGINATIDFPTWNSIDYPLDTVYYEYPLVHCEIAGAKGPDTFDGQVKGESILGVLSLRGRKAHVQLHRKDSQRPYRQEAITIEHNDVSLAGTLLIPNRNGPYAAVILIAGSGPSTQVESRGMADQFVRQGIATLIYDKRGTGNSTGNWQEATFEDLAHDVVAAMHHLKDRADVDSKQIGLHGTSQGGWIAHLASSHLSDVAFVITIASPAVTPRRQVLYEVATRLRQQGFSNSDISLAITLKERFDEYARTGENRNDVAAELESVHQEPWFKVMEDLPYPLPSFERLKWWRSVMDFDPLPYLQRVKCPLLAIFGERDAVVDTQESVKILQELQTKRAISIRVFDRANHSLMVFPEAKEPFRWFGFADHYLDSVISWTDCVLASNTDHKC